MHGFSKLMGILAIGSSSKKLFCIDGGSSACQVKKFLADRPSCPKGSTTLSPSFEIPKN